MKYIVVIIFLISTIMLSGLAIDEELEQARGRFGQIIVGRGEAESELEADRIALQDLTSQILVTVQGSFKNIAKEDGVTVEEYCEKVVTTYSNVKLANAIKLVESKGKAVIVYRYITNEEKERLFRERRSQILNFVIEGERALKKDNITDALRNYYWALILLKSHPDGESISYFWGDDERLLQIALPSEMEKILAKIKIELINSKSEANSNCTELVFQVSYNNQPVNGLLINYHDGYRWSQQTKWTNGLEYININNTTLKSQKRLVFKIDYTFANHSFCEEISKAMNSISPITLQYSEKSVELTKKDFALQKKKNNDFTYDSSVSKTTESIINDVLDAISTKDLVQARKHFTAKGFQQFNALMGYGNAAIIPSKTTIKQAEFTDNKVIRSIPMKFSFSSSKENFTERVNFILDKNEKIDGISFALSQEACSDILNKDFATDEEKMLIINFVEQYKTAYCLKDIDFIQKVFSNDALIIVGNVVRTEPDKFNDKLYGQLNKTTVEYVKLNKEQYVERLAKQFNNQEFINIRFSDNSIDKVMSDNNKVFGIQIAQYYYSASYADAGYLFLMFDLHDIKHPKIMVRSWQPEKNEDGSIIGLENFSWE